MHHRRLQLIPVEGFPIAGRWHWVSRAERRTSPATAALQRFATAQAESLADDLARLRQAARRRAAGRATAR